MLLYLQGLGGAIARAHKWTFTFIDCYTITGITLIPLYWDKRALSNYKLLRKITKEPEAERKKF